MLNPSDEKWKSVGIKAWTLVGLGIVGLAILNLCGILWQAVSAVVITAFLVFLLSGFVDKFEAKGRSRALGVGIAFLIILLVIGGVVALIIPSLATQIANFASNLPVYAQEAQTFLANNSDPAISAVLNEATNFIKNQGGNILSGVANGVMGTAANVGSWAMVIMIALICSAWVLIDMKKMGEELFSLLSDKQAKTLRIMTTSLSVAFSGWLRSTLICAVITGVVSWIVFFILQIPYAMLLGVVCMIMYLIPYVGPAISMVIVAVIAIFVSPLACILSIVANGVIGFVVGNLISPRLMQSSVSVHPTITLVAILIGGALAGPVGMLLSIPIAAAAQTFFVVVWENKTGKVLGTKDGALFRCAEEEAPSKE